MLNFPSNCAKSLITLYCTLLSKFGKSLPPLMNVSSRTPYSTRSATAEPRSNDFLFRHILCLPFAQEDRCQMTGLLKCVGIELSLSCARFFWVVQREQQHQQTVRRSTGHYVGGDGLGRPYKGLREAQFGGGIGEPAAVP